MTDVSNRQVRRVIAELDELSDTVRFTVGAPTGPGWSPVAVTPEILQLWHHADLVLAGDRRFAAMTLGAALCSAPVLLLGAPAVLAEVVVGTDLTGIEVRRGRAGGIDGFALLPGGAWPVDDAPVAAARRVATCAAPLIGAVADTLPVGRRALWGACVDALGAYVSGVARQRGGDTVAVQDRLESFYDALRRDVPQLVRPTPLPITWSGGTAWFQTRGTCCLRYRAVTDGPVADAYCSTCPRRTDGSGREVIRRYLELTAPGGR